MAPPENRTPPANEVHIWTARLDGGGWPSVEGLPVTERDRAAAMLDPKVRRRWGASRWALRTALGRYLTLEPAEIVLRESSHGKPEVAAPERGSLRFNLSHSAEVALVAIASGREVGVDVEQVRPRRNLAALARRALAPDEAGRVEAASSESRLETFHAAWARREAVAKCFGVGVGAPLPDRPVAVLDLETEPGFAAAVAVAVESAPALRRFSLGPADVEG